MDIELETRPMVMRVTVPYDDAVRLRDAVAAMPSRELSGLPEPVRLLVQGVWETLDEVLPARSLVAS